MLSKFKNSSVYKKFIEVDFIGPLLTFEDNDSVRFKSIQGALFSFSIVITVMIISIMFGKEIYERKIPLITISNENLKESIIKLSEFPIILEFRDKQGNPIHDFNQFIKFFTLEIQMDSNNKISQKSNDFGLIDCNSKTFKNYTKDVENLIKNRSNNSSQFQKYFCLDFKDENKFKNEYYSTDSMNFNFGFRKCQTHSSNENSTSDINLNLPLCESSSSNNKKSINDVVMTIHYITSFIDFDNIFYPVNSYLESINIEFNSVYFKRNYMRFTLNKFYSDLGFLLEDYKIINYALLQSIVPDDMLVSNTGFEKDAIFMITLESPKIITIVKRHYMKIQDLFAKIGGVANALLIIFKLMSYHYLRFLYIYFIKDLTEQTVKNEGYFHLSDRSNRGIEKDVNNHPKRKSEIIQDRKSISVKTGTENHNLRYSRKKISSLESENQDEKQHYSNLFDICLPNEVFKDIKHEKNHVIDKKKLPKNLINTQNIANASTTNLKDNELPVDISIVSVNLESKPKQLERKHIVTIREEFKPSKISITKNNLTEHAQKFSETQRNKMKIESLCSQVSRPSIISLNSVNQDQQPHNNPEPKNSNTVSIGNKNYLKKFTTTINDEEFGFSDYIFSLLCCKKTKYKRYQMQMETVKHALSFRILVNLLIGYIIQETKILEESDRLINN